jgi:hypothetical protein
LNQPLERSRIEGCGFDHWFFIAPDSQIRVIWSWGGEMRQGEPSKDTELSHDDPYAPPRAMTEPADGENESNEAEIQRKKHIRRESCIRVTGLLSLILAVIVILVFGLGTLSELRKLDPPGEALEPWMYLRWIVRMTIVISLAVIAAVISWGLFRLRNWGRWLLTVVATVPVPVLLGGWLLLNRIENPELRESLESSGLIALSVMAALSCPLLLFLTWSSKSKYVFLPGYRDTIRQTSHLRPGYRGILAAMLIVPAMFASYFALLMTLLSILALLDFIRST